MDFIKYKHHDEEVTVREDLKGKHREYCLCFQGGKKFKPGNVENCDIAESVYTHCAIFDIVTPVWECPDFEQKHG